MADSSSKIRILYIKPGPVPPEENLNRNQISFLSKELCGDVLQPRWGTKKNCDNLLNQGSFTYHFCFTTKLPGLLAKLIDTVFYIYKGLQIYYFGNRYQVIVSYGVGKTGLSSLILKFLTKAKLIVELSGAPHASTLISRKVSYTQKLLTFFNNRVLNCVCSFADGIRLLYPTQLDSYPKLKVKKKFIFQEFTPISDILPSETDDGYVLFIGGPWHIKGVDILIQAFLEINKVYPDLKLKIVGWDYEPQYYYDLAGGNPQIEFLKGVKYHQALELFSKCKFFVLPSRSESMGRVLLEAMASGKAVIASRVDGIPFYIPDGKCGLLFESENVSDLKNKMSEYLSNPDLRIKLAQSGFNYVHENLNEERYVVNFCEMIKEVCK